MIKRKRNLYLENQYFEQGSCCYYCKDNVPFEYITRDHFNPVSQGNTLVDNKVFACRSCNSIKGSRTILEFKANMIKRCHTVIEKIKKKKYSNVDNELQVLKRYIRIIKTLDEIVKNDYKPNIIFT